jgi:CheY-like chemotaxis protein
MEFPVLPGRKNHVKILVVDDEAIITMQLEERLSAMGYTIAGMAASGEDAVAKARQYPPRPCADGYRDAGEDEWH